MRIFKKIHQKLNWSNRRYVGLILAMLLLSYFASAIYHVLKPMPEGLNYTGKMHHADVKFLADRTYLDDQGQQHLDQHIFNEMLKMIEEAQTTIVLDVFLFNKEVGASNAEHRKLMSTLSQALIQKRRMQPNIEIKLITDPINSVYGGVAPEHYRLLRQAGIDVIETNLSPLRASNPIWSGFWYLCCQGLGNNAEHGWLTDPFGADPITLRSYFSLLNFKANHRKTLVVDTNSGWKTLVTSMNPHDGSSRHSNVALVVHGLTALDVLKTEQAVGIMSDADMPMVVVGKFPEDQSLPQVQVLTEKSIYDAILNSINTAKKTEKIDMAMFYLSERKIIQALKNAHLRGVEIRVLLDPNKDAFGRSKNGIPNRPVAAELHRAGIPVRWCNTQGEQCHAKMLIKQNQQQSEIILGSANFTARNLKNYNLETDLRVIGQPEEQVFKDASQFFNEAWLNTSGKNISVNYQKYADNSAFKYWVYRFMEWSGLSTF